MRNNNETTTISAPVRLLLTIIVSTFTVEMLIMFTLPALPPLSVLVHAAVDSISLVILIFPVVYFFSYRPMIQHIAKRKRAEAELQKALDELEVRIQERTEKLARTNQELQVEICERKQTEEALHRSESRLACILENAAEAIVTIDQNQKIILFNKGAEKIFGYQVDEVLGQPLDVLLPQTITNIHRQEVQALGTLSPTSRPMATRREVIGRRKDGVEFPARVGISTHTESGQVVFTAVLVDITEQKVAEARIRAEAARAETLYRVADRLNAQLNLDTVLTAVCEAVALALKAPLVSIALYDETSKQIIHTGEAGRPKGIFHSFQPVPRAVYDRLVKRFGPVASFENIQAIPGIPNLNYYHQANIQSLLCVSMLRDGNLIGTINIFGVGQSLKFEEDEIALVKGIANEAAQAITNARLFEEIRARASQLSLLYDMGLVLNSILEPRTQLEYLFKIARDTLDTDRAGFYRFEAVHKELHLELTIGYEENFKSSLPNIPLRDERFAASWVGNNRLPLNIHDVQNDPRFTPLVSDTCCLLLVPVERNGQLLGILYVDRTQLKPFTLQDERLLLLFANQAAVAMENAHLFSNAERRLSQVKALRKIDIAITNNADLQTSLETILDQLTSQLGVDAAHVLNHNPHTLTLDYMASTGFRTTVLQHTSLRLGQGYAGRAALERRTIHIPDLQLRQTDFLRSPTFTAEAFVSYFVVPLIAKGQVKGVLEIFHRSLLNPDAEWLEFLGALAGQTAIAIDNAGLFTDLQRSNLELTMAYDATIEGWSRALDLRDNETEGHTRRVTEITLRLARAMDISEAELVHVRRGAMLHDIGKMGVPDYILHKPGPLTDEEWVIMRKHPVYAYEMLAPITYLKPALDIPYCHHEKWDGTGYPRGLKGEQIPLVARIFAVVDVWDALRSDRPYRRAMPEVQVREYLREQSGLHFDPNVVNVFFQQLCDRQDC